MSLFFTPGQFSRRAEFYHQLGQLTGAGLGVMRALEHLQKRPPARSYREPLRRVLAELSGGFTLGEALRRCVGWLPALDQSLLQAGEQSGRLDVCFRLLADYYTERARVARQILVDLAYPAFLFHFAVFILPFPKLFLTGDWEKYLLQTFGVLVPVYAVIALMIYAAQSGHGERWRSWIERLLRPVPVLGTARAYLALSRLAAALGALLASGVTIIEAWEMAATASGSPALRRTVLGWRRQVDGGVTPAEVVNASGRFPDLFASQYATGEISGTLEETLQRLYQYYQDEGSRKLRAVARWTPMAVYILVMGLIAYKVVTFWMGYFQDIGKAGGF
jgi:type IV pilus assembly protein PilC